MRELAAAYQRGAAEVLSARDSDLAGRPGR
jgi:hypothetical protein